MISREVTVFTDIFMNICIYLQRSQSEGLQRTIDGRSDTRLRLVDSEAMDRSHTDQCLAGGRHDPGVLGLEVQLLR